MKTTIEGAPAGNHTVLITSDFNVTGVVNIPTNVNIELKSDSNRNTLTRAVGYTGRFFNLGTANSSLSITNLVIDGNKANVSAASRGEIFYLHNATTALTIGNNTIIKNQSKTSSGHGAVVYIDNDGGSLVGNGGTLIIEGNAEIFDNVTQDGIIYVQSIDATTIIRGDVKFSNNAAMSNAASSNAGLMINYGKATITDNVEISGCTARENIGVIWNHYTGVMTISGNVKIHDNSTTSMAGIANNNVLTIKDNVKIYNNTATTGQTGAITSFRYSASYPAASGQVTLNLLDNVEIYNNKAQTFGGGVSNSTASELNISGNVKIHDNEAMAAAGIYNIYRMTMGGNAELYNNRATGDPANTYSNGGGMRLAGIDNQTIIKDNVKIYNNETLNNTDGGAIFIGSSVVNPVQILGNVQITGNTAAKDGGGIYTQEYVDLVVAQDVIFNNNQASVGYNVNLPVVDPTNYAIYQNNILVPNNTWTTSRIYGYNNYDINYAGETPAYVVRYDANGGSGAVPEDRAYTIGDSVQVNFNTIPTKKGYVFKGWSINNDDQTPTYSKDGTTTFVMPERDVGLYAIWEKESVIKETYTIKYHGNRNTGGQVPIDNRKYARGEKVKILGSGTLVKKDYKFIGWNTKIDGHGKMYQPQDMLTIEGNVILYAQWKSLPVEQKQKSAPILPDTGNDSLLITGILLMLGTGMVVPIIRKNNN